MTRSTHPFEPEEVMAYLDGELTLERAAAAAMHLEQCTECRAIASDMRSVSKQMLAWQVEASPGRLADGVGAAAQAELRRREPVNAKTVFAPWSQKLRFHRMIWGLSACAALLLLFAIAVPNFLRSRNIADQRVTGLSEPEVGPRNIANQRVTGLDKLVTQPARKEQLATTVADQLEGVPGPMVVRNATLAVVVKEFEQGRAAMEALLRVHRGYAANLSVETPQNAGRFLTATLQLPGGELDAALAELKKLGRVEQESQTAEEVTRQYVDLTARLKNSRETEQRLIQVLRERTGKVVDVLEVEREIARVRGEIEQMDAQRKNLEHQVRYATLQLKLSEEYKAALDQPHPSAGTRLGNALIEGFREAIESSISFLVFVLGVAPWLALWTLLLFWPARLAWRRARVLITR
ncbi:MAG: DUF4349 domain-containing protein [Acidipila sp.]|nr:DUF4349 domain-containing protein [Acidipila sp.]